MKRKHSNLLFSSALNVVFVCLLLCLLLQCSHRQVDTHSLSIKISVSEDLQKDFIPDGRLFLFFDKSPGYEPRFNPPLGWGYCMFAKNINGWNAGDAQSVYSTKGWDSFQPKSFLLKKDSKAGLVFRKPWDIEEIPKGTYYVQGFWDQYTTQSILNSPGDLYSEVIEVKINNATDIEISLSKIIPPVEIMDHKLIKEVKYLSDTLTKWWGNQPTSKLLSYFPVNIIKIQVNHIRYVMILLDLVGVIHGLTII